MKGKHNLSQDESMKGKFGGANLGTMLSINFIVLHMHCSSTQQEQHSEHATQECGSL